MRLANDSQRHNVYGQTGSGKTVAGLWALEKRSFDRRPWIIIDSKRDPTIARIPRLEEIDIRGNPPRKGPGLYVVRPNPGQDDILERFLWRVWHNEKTGLFIDEGHRIDRFNHAYDAIVTQGRSKRIPVIALSQRPAWLPRFVMSEADFHQVLHIANPTDFKKLNEWIPGLQLTRRDYHSQYFDVARGEMTYLAPVPNEDVILERFNDKVPRKVKLFSNFAHNAGRSRRKRPLEMTG